MRKDNRGFSLIELIVAVAIMAIVGIAIASFMITGSKSYASTSAEVNLQYEAQLAMNQINDLMIDATEGVTYEIDGTKVLKDSEGPTDPSSKVLYIYSSQKDESTGVLNYYVDVINWQKADNRLYYSKYNVIKTDDVYTVDTAITTNKLMTEYVSLFSVNLEELASHNIFKLALSFETGTRTYDSHNNTTLRNTLAVNRKGTGGSGGGGVIITPATVTDVIIQQGNIILAPGGNANFTALVKGTGSPSQEVTWELVGAHDTGTKIDASGKLVVSGTESNASFRVKATSVEDNSKSATIIVYIKKVNEIKVNGGPEHLYKNTSFTLNAVVSGINITEEDKLVRWSVTDGAAYITMTGGSSFKVAANAPKDLKVTIRATSAVDASMYAEWTKKVEEGTGGGDDPDSPAIVVTSPGKINRNGSGTFTAAVSNADGYYIKWEVSVYKKSDSGEKYGSLVYDVHSSGTNCTVNISRLLSFDVEAVVEARAYLVKTGGTAGTTPGAISQAEVPAVSIKYRKAAGTSELDKITDKVYYAKTSETRYSYTVYGIQDFGSISWKDYDKNVLSIADSGGSISLGAPTVAEKATTKAVPAIGTYRMNDNTVEITSVGGNVKDNDGNYYYIPIPTESDFQGYGRETECDSKGEYPGFNCTHVVKQGLGKGNYAIGLLYISNNNANTWKIFIYDSSRPWSGTAYTYRMGVDEEWQDSSFW